MSIPERTPSPPKRTSTLDHGTLRKILFTSVTGIVTFAVSNFLQDRLKVSLAEQLILATVVGGVTLISQFLADFSEQQVDFGQRLERLEQNSLRQLMEASALQTDLLTRFVRRSSRIDHTSSELVRDLAHHEVERVSGLMRSLSGGEEVFYDGEDREWLLGLAHNARRTIVATSLVTVDAGGKSFEGGLWLNDLGARYLDIQRAARRRGVQIRRIFVFDAPDFEEDPSFVRVRRLQREAGVEIRGLDESRVPEHLKDHISDFIVFDNVLGYETTRPGRKSAGLQPAIVTTRIVLDKHRVERSTERFEEMWLVAKLLPDDQIDLDQAGSERTGSERIGSGGVRASTAGEHVPDPVEGIGG
jgi:hypothetical protein